MSLFFEECVKKEERNAAADPKKDMITFCIPLIFSIPSIPDTAENSQILRSRLFRTTYNVYSAKWKYELTNNNFKIETAENAWNESCYFSYKLFSVVEMDSEIYSSERMPLIPEQKSDWFCAPEDAMDEFCDAYQKRKIAKIVILVEIKLRMKLYIRPFEIQIPWLYFKPCEDYPEDMKTDFRFEFLEDGDFTFKCSDGTVQAVKMVMNLTPLKKYLNESNNDEFVINHRVDVIQPIITYFHSGCFEMPKSYDLDFADRFLKAFDFFELEDEDNFPHRIRMSICQKFVKDPLDFELILEWLSLASRHYIPFLDEMIAATIAQKYYYQWLQRFPENTRTDENEMLKNFFGSADRAFWHFHEIQEIFLWSSLINVILS